MRKGIDYGNGRTNVDRETGIRFGVIPFHDVMQTWCDESEADYGAATCPKCGREATDYSEAYNDFDADIAEDSPEHIDNWERAAHECDDYACARCRYIFGSESAFGDEPLGHTYNANGYECSQYGDVDIFITKSPYYTRASYCSPCAPGACYLRSAHDGGQVAYCFGHDWFESGRAPYPVYRVSDNTEVLP